SLRQQDDVGTGAHDVVLSLSAVPVSDVATELLANHPASDGAAHGSVYRAALRHGGGFGDCVRLSDRPDAGGPTPRYRTATPDCGRKLAEFISHPADAIC